MSRRRFFVDEVSNGSAKLEGDDARHLTQVLRVAVGQKYEISDNEAVFLAEVEIARKQQVVFRVLERLADPEPLSPLKLFVSLIKFDRLEVIFEKATELGVASIQLVQAERSEKGLAQAAEKRFTRWRRIVLESSQQSRRSRLPELLPVMPFQQALQEGADFRLFLDEERIGVPLLSAIQGASRTESIHMLVGPEGGWTDQERESARQNGWTAISLGPLILRAETAAVAALAIASAVLHG